MILVCHNFFRDSLAIPYPIAIKAVKDDMFNTMYTTNQNPMFAPFMSWQPGFMQPMPWQPCGRRVWEPGEERQS
jgi:hypothetical protein